MPTMIASRPWRGYEDLPLMQQLALEQRRRLGVRAPWHVGESEAKGGVRCPPSRTIRICAALLRLYEEGGRQAIVYCVTEPACALYGALGFHRHATQVSYSRG